MTRLPPTSKMSVVALANYRSALAGLLLSAGPICVVPGVAYAERTSDDKALATLLFEQGRALIVEGNIPEACQKFAESQRLDIDGGEHEVRATASDREPFNVERRHRHGVRREACAGSESALLPWARFCVTRADEGTASKSVHRGAGLTIRAGLVNLRPLGSGAAQQPARHAD